MLSIREAGTTRAWPATAKSELSAQGKQAWGPPDTEGFPRQDWVSLCGALPTVQRETEGPGKEGQPGREEDPQCPQATGFTLDGHQEAGSRTQLTQGARPLGTPLFLGAWSLKESLCCAHRI